MQATADQSAANRMEAWLVAYPDVSGWLFDNCESNDFAASLAISLQKYGSLTDNQVSAVRRKLVPGVAAVAISVHEIEMKFAVARGNLVKQPRIRLDTFKFTAVIKGANAGGIYVTDTTEKDDDGKAKYLGKVLGGKFLPTRECSDDQKSRILAAAADPTAAAIAYGQRTGNCSICGLELTAEESIQRIIGPICASRWGML